MTTTCPFRPNQIAYVNLFPGISSILDNLNSWRIENTESSRRVYSNMRSTREILSGHSAPYFHDDRLHRRDNRPRYHEDRLHSLWSRQLTVMATVFVVKNRIPHSRKPFFDEEPEFTAIPKGCALLLTKQYYTIPPFQIRINYGNNFASFGGSPDTTFRPVRPRQGHGTYSPSSQVLDK